MESFYTHFWFKRAWVRKGIQNFEIWKYFPQNIEFCWKEAKKRKDPSTGSGTVKLDKSDILTNKFEKMIYSAQL